MKDNSFEQYWRKALGNASEEPAWRVWHNIETKLIEEENGLENILQSKFEQAEIAVPAFVWDNIEAELDKKDRKVPVFWLFTGRRVAAGIAALFLFSLGVYFSSNNNITPLQTSKNTVSGQKSNTENKVAGSSEIAENNKEKLQEKLSQPTRIITDPLAVEIAFNSAKINNKAGKPDLEKWQIDDRIFDESLAQKSADEIVKVQYSDLNEKENLNKLESKGFEVYSNRFTMDRKRLGYEDSDNEIFAFENYGKKSWFGFISGLAPFDPNISINNFERAALVSSNNLSNSAFQFNSVVETNTDEKRAVFAIPLSQPYNDVKSGRSMNIGFDLGQKITNRIGLQTGARYMNGLSYITSNVYTYNERTGDVKTFLESKYLSNDNQKFNNTVIASQGGVQNVYQFIMVPVQLSYHQPLFARVELAISGGVSGDFMINNVIDGITYGGSNLNPKNSAYKTAMLSGLGGVKLNYNVGRNWQTSIGGMYQQTLTSGINSQQENLIFKPRYIGINYGFNYRF